MNTLSFVTGSTEQINFENKLIENGIYFKVQEYFHFRHHMVRYIINDEDFPFALEIEKKVLNISTNRKERSVDKSYTVIKYIILIFSVIVLIVLIIGFIFSLIE